MTREEAIKELRGFIGQLTEGCQEAIKVLIPELAESEDERIRRKMIEHFKNKTKETWCNMPVKDIIAYLEKQKDSKWSPSEGEMGVLYKLCYISNQVTDEDDTELTRLYQDLKREYFNGHSFENMFPKAEKEQKPAEWNELQSEFRSINEAFEDGKKEVIANPEKYGLCKHEEWSEEDENMIDDIIRALTKMAESEDNILPEILPSVAQKYVERLKSLPLRCPKSSDNWKPSEHQMNILKAVKDYVGKGSGYWGEGLGSLIDDLEKLM